MPGLKQKTKQVFEKQVEITTCAARSVCVNE